MEKPINLKEAEKLAERYENLTLEKIEKIYAEFHKKPESSFFKSIMEYLTGFGNQDSCLLCRSIQHDIFGIDCWECLYVKTTGTDCNIGINKKTYYAIAAAENPVEIKKAVDARAIHIRKLIELWK